MPLAWAWPHSAAALGVALGGLSAVFGVLAVALPLSAAESEVSAVDVPASATVPAPDVAAVAGGGEEAAPVAGLTARAAPPLAGASRMARLRMPHWMAEQAPGRR